MNVSHLLVLIFSLVCSLSEASAAEDGYKEVFRQNYMIEALLQNCIQADEAEAKKLTKKVCYPHDTKKIGDKPKAIVKKSDFSLAKIRQLPQRALSRYRFNSTASCEEDFAKKLSKAEINVNLDWADAIVFAEHLGEPNTPGYRPHFDEATILLNTDPHHTAKGGVIAVLPVRDWCKDMDLAIQDLAHLSDLWARIVSDARIIATKKEVMEHIVGNPNDIFQIFEPYGNCFPEMNVLGKHLHFYSKTTVKNKSTAAVEDAIDGLYSDAENQMEKHVNNASERARKEMKNRFEGNKKRLESASNMKFGNKGEVTCNGQTFFMQKDISELYAKAFRESGMGRLPATVSYMPLYGEQKQNQDPQDQEASQKYVSLSYQYLSEYEKKIEKSCKYNENENNQYRVSAYHSALMATNDSNLLYLDEEHKKRGLSSKQTLLYGDGQLVEGYLPEGCEYELNSIGGFWSSPPNMNCSKANMDQPMGAGMNSAMRTDGTDGIPDAPDQYE